MSRKSPAPPRPRTPDRPRGSRGTARDTNLRLPRTSWTALALVALALLLTVDDRYAGAIADGRQTTWTAVAIVETGEIGQARGRDFTWRRAEGDAVSRYGIGMSLVQVPAAWLAPAVDARLGAGASQPLFLVAPILLVCLAAWAAGWAALLLGAGDAGAVAAITLASLGGPLAAYAGLDLSEPLQAASLVLALAAALGAGEEGIGTGCAGRRAVLAGLAAGAAVLTKSSLVVVAPFALLPLMAPGGSLTVRRRLSFALGGAVVPVAAWLFFELHQFGTLFASYGGEGFTHPFVDGAWRLLVGANRGLVLYFPATMLALFAAHVAKGDVALRRAAVWGALGVLAALLALAAPWWAWHGVWGWGPRLLVPSVPVLAVPAALTVGRWPRWSRGAFLAVSVLINAPGLLQNAAPVNTFTAGCLWPVADEAAARSLAAYAWRQAPDGSVRVSPDTVLATVPSASPLVTHPWFLAVTATSDAEDVTRRLSSPPWAAARPDIACDPSRTPGLVPGLLRRPGWTVWGRGFWPDPAARGFPGVYVEGLLDQIVRAQQLGRGAQALALAQRYAALVPGGEADAQILESLRVLGRRADAVAYLSSLSRERRSEPKVNVVLALFERDAGNEPMARGLLGSVVALLPGTPAEQALNAPFASWPRDLMGMTTGETDQAGR